MSDSESIDIPEEEHDLFIDLNDVIEEFPLGEEPPVDDDDDDLDAMDESTPLLLDSSQTTFSEHSAVVYAVSINPVKPTQILSGGGDDRGFIWNLSPDGKLLDSKELGGHTDTVSNVGFSYDGSLAATAGFDGRIQIWDTQLFALKACLEGPDDIEWISWHSKGNVILAGGKNGTVWMWLAITGECMRVFTGHDGPVTCGTFTSNGRLAITGGEDCTVRVWVPKSGECRHVFQGYGFHEGPITCIAIHPDPEQSHMVMLGSQDGKSSIVHVQGKKILSTFLHSVNDIDSHSVESVGFCGWKPWCATGGTDGYLKIWDWQSGLCRISCKHPAGVTKLRWHPSQPIVYTSCADGILRAWDALNGNCSRTFSGHSDMVNDFDIYFPRDSMDFTGWLVSVSDDTTSKVFSLSDDHEHKDAEIILMDAS